MIAVGIPSWNEADNIAQLVRKIDDCAINCGIELVIINADNSSPDGTARVFRSQHTKNIKVSLVTQKKGKGYNLEAILKYVAKNDIEYCCLIDGDVTSFEPVWLEKHLDAASNGYDYIVPSYARYMQEGNATNHFAYPLLSCWTNSRAPRQPLSGDFGVSHSFAVYLSGLDWPEAAYQYGVDMFMTLHALGSGFRVIEIHLPRKIHKPSFPNMIEIFSQEAEVYYLLRSQLSFKNASFQALPDETQLLMGTPISDENMNNRLQDAERLYAVNKRSSKYKNLPKHVSKEEWAAILLEHEQMVGKKDPRYIANSICPFYLVRVVSYLKDISSTAMALQEIKDQQMAICNAYANAGLLDEQ